MRNKTSGPNLSTGARPALAGRRLFLLSLLTATDAMAIDTYLPAMPDMANDLAVSASQVQQTLPVFLVGLAIGQAVYGPVLDRYGRRLPLLYGMVIFSLGSAMAALAPDISWLMAARLLQALGAAAGLVAPRAIVADVCNLTQSARLFSILSQVMMVAPILAPVIGSHLLDWCGWRSIFWSMAILGVLGLIWCWHDIYETQPAENRSAHKLTEMMAAYTRLCRHRIFVLRTAAGGFFMGALFTYISCAPFIFTQHFSLSPVVFGYLFAGNALSFVAGGALSAALLRHGTSEHRVLYIGILLLGGAGCGLFLAQTLGYDRIWLTVMALAMSMAAQGLIFGTLTALTMAQAAKQAGTASALMGTAQYLLAALTGYVVSLAPAAGPVTLALALTGCATIGALLCGLADRAPNHPA